MKNICTDCSDIIDKYGITTTKNHLFPPKEYLPKINELASKWIIMGSQFARRYLFFYAAESDTMEQNLIDTNISNEAKSYDNFQNSGIVQLDDKGMANIVLHYPKSYKGTNGITYDTHIHYRVTDKSNKKWNKTEYTVRLN